MANHTAVYSQIKDTPCLVYKDTECLTLFFLFFLSVAMKGLAFFVNRSYPFKPNWYFFSLRKDLFYTIPFLSLQLLTTFVSLICPEIILTTRY